MASQASYLRGEFWFHVGIGICLASFCTASAAASEPGLQLTCHWLDPHHLVTFSPKSLGRHVTSIFEEIGVDVEWKNSEITKVAAGGNELIIVLRPSEPAGLGLHPRAMGAVFRPESAQRQLFIFFPSVARILGYQPKALSGRLVSMRERRALVRGLARVIAHEIFHVIAPELPHAPTGLTSAILSRENLLEPKVSVHPHSAEVFRQELARMTPVPPRIAMK